ncbi:MAG TPA: HAMP domain-containing sensor histidine kinase, partial [Oscillospiraceae bacterium]|nr:HAMP domain-containing sensor histidine kinase [Oscillospiraceae bacterium]
MKHIFSKLTLAFIGMAALSVGLIWLVQAVFLGDSYLNQRIATIDAAAADISVSTGTDYAALETSLNVSLLAVDEDGDAVYQSASLPMRGQVVRKIPELIESAGGGVQYLQTESADTRYALLSRAVNGGYLLIVFSMVDVNEASRVLLQQLWIITAVLFAAALLLSVLLSRLFSRPILRVTEAAKRMAAGEYNVSVPVTTQDEIGQLTGALNELGVELGKAENLRRELIANVSHELRAPLTIIQGFAETVRDITWPDEEKRTAQLTMIAGEATRLSAMVTDILDYSRLESGAETIVVSEFESGTALGELVDRFEIEAGKKDVALELQGPERTIRFDRGKFIQVMNNLLSNAVQHASRRSVVRVRCEESGGALRISVENAGKPIPAEEREKIWDRYHRAPREGAAGGLGTGLGLA